MTVMSKYPYEKGTEFLELLVSHLQDIQSGLTKEYHNEVILQNTLLNAVKDVDACKLAYFKPAPDLSGIIADLHASFGVVLPRKEAIPQVFFFFRKFKGNRRGGSSKSCFVCKNEGCWSTKYTPAERMNALMKNKIICSYLTCIAKDLKTDEEEEVADQLEEIAAYVIGIDSYENDFGKKSFNASF